MRRVVTPKSELESNQNKKTTLASFKNYGDSKEDLNDKTLYLSLENNNSKKNYSIKNIKMTEKSQNTNLKNQSRNNKIEDNEEAIIISKRKGYLDTISNEEDEEVVCCTSGCHIF